MRTAGGLPVILDGEESAAELMTGTKVIKQTAALHSPFENQRSMSLEATLQNGCNYGG